MKPEDILNEDFLKQFKNGTELTNFLEQLGLPNKFGTIF